MTLRTETKIEDGMTDIINAHFHHEITLCWHDGIQAHERYLKGDAAEAVIAAIDSEPDEDGRREVLRHFIRMGRI